LVVAFAKVVHHIESVGLANTYGVLAAGWDSSLAYPLCKIVVLVAWAGKISFEFVIAPVVGLAEVVDEVESIGLANTIGMLASNGYSALTCASVEVEVSIVTAREACVEPVITLVVCVAQGVNQVKSIDFADATGVLTTTGYRRLTLASGEVEVLVGTA